MRSNQHFQQFNVRASKSKLVFFFLFFPQLFDSLLLQQFVRVTYVLFPSSLGEQSEETYRHIDLGDRHSSKCQKVFIVTFDFALPIPSLQLYFNAEFYCYILRYVANFFAAVFFHQRQTCLLVATFHCSTNTEVFCYIFLCVVNSLLCQFPRCSVPPTFICIVSCASFPSINDSRFFFTTLHCCHQPNGQLIISYLDSSVCSRGSQITSSSHLNWGNVRFPERY